MSFPGMLQIYYDLTSASTSEEIYNSNAIFDVGVGIDLTGNAVDVSDSIKQGWVNSIKILGNTASGKSTYPVRISSQAATPTEYSYIYATWSDVYEGRSVGDIKDENNLTSGTITFNTGKDINISGGKYNSFDNTTYTNVDIIKTTAFSSAVAGTIGIDGFTRYFNKNGTELSEIAQSDINKVDSIGKYYYHTDKTIWIIVEKGTYEDLVAAKAGLGVTSLIYKLLTPTTAKNTKQSLKIYEGGNFKVERIIHVRSMLNGSNQIVISELPDVTLSTVSFVKRIDIDGIGKPVETTLSSSAYTLDTNARTITINTSPDSSKVYIADVYYSSSEGSLPTVVATFPIDWASQTQTNNTQLQLLNDKLQLYIDNTVATLIDQELRITQLEA